MASEIPAESNGGRLTILGTYGRRQRGQMAPACSKRTVSRIDASVLNNVIDLTSQGFPGFLCCSAHSIYEKCSMVMKFMRYQFPFSNRRKTSMADTAH